MFAALKVIGTLLLAGVSIVAAIWESAHPLLFSCACAAVTDVSWQDVQADVIGRVSMVSRMVFFASMR